MDLGPNEKLRSEYLWLSESSDRICILKQNLIPNRVMSLKKETLANSYVQWEHTVEFMLTAFRYYDKQYSFMYNKCLALRACSCNVP